MESGILDIITWVTLGIAVFGWVLTGLQSRKASELREEDKKVREQERQEDKEASEKLWQRQEKFNLSQSPLSVEAQLNQISNPKAAEELRDISVYDAYDNHIYDYKGDFVKFFVNSGWVSKVYIIDACFKDSKSPYVDLSKYYNNTQTRGQEFKERIQESEQLWVEESGRRIRIASRKVLNFYPGIDGGVFYQFFLVEGSDKQCFLYIYGLDKVGDQLVPFVLDRRGIASTVNSINSAFKREYQELSAYLKTYGYNL